MNPASFSAHPESSPLESMGKDRLKQSTLKLLADIRRGYNLMGIIDLGRDDTKSSGVSDEYIAGDAQHWIKRILNWYYEYRQDTFIFWPAGGNGLIQIEAFAQEISPAVRQAIDQSVDE